MRLFPLLFSLPLLAVSALAQDQWIESPATLTLKLSSSGEPTIKPGKNDTVIHESSIQRIRLGNRDILEALLIRGLIDQIEGWRVIGIWANWPEPADPYVGNAYRFYARRGKGSNIETIAIPSDLLSIQPLESAIGYRHVIAATDFIRSGTNTFSIYQQVTFGLGGHEGVVTGVASGSGRYVRVSGGTAAGRYLPNASKATLQGEYADEGEETVGVVSGSLSFGAASLVTRPLPQNDGREIDIGDGGGVGVGVNTAEFTPTGGTLKISGGLIKTGTGTLTLSGADIAPGAPGTIIDTANGTDGLLLSGSNTGGLTLGGGTALIFPGGSITAGNLYAGSVSPLSGVTLIDGSTVGSFEPLGGVLLLSLNSGFYSGFTTSTLVSGYDLVVISDSGAFSESGPFSLGDGTWSSLGTTFTFDTIGGILTLTTVPEPVP